MQITHIEVTPVELDLRQPYRMVDGGELNRVGAVFCRVETKQGETAWGCTAVDPAFMEVSLEEVTRACRDCADRALDLNPLNFEFALSELSDVAGDVPAALCAFDLAFHDLLGLVAKIPLYRLLGGFRHRIQTSMTVGRAGVQETVQLARDYAKRGFRILKIKSGQNPEEDVRRMHAVRDALPNLTLRLDVEGRYTVQQTVDVARALEGELEMIEQPTPADDVGMLREATRRSRVPILADESVRGPSSALEIASRRAADGMNVKLVACGGLRCARQMDAIARAARMATMVGCVHEPALLIAAGLGFALSSANVRYGDLDGAFYLENDPTVPGYVLEDGWLVARDVPGLGCSVEL
jgi:L-alanine-DL-glutamate epimerase-like enolase superfamily enzyme